MAKSDHTTTSASSATVPISLRMRGRMTASLLFKSAGRATSPRIGRIGWAHRWHLLLPASPRSIGSRIGSTRALTIMQMPDPAGGSRVRFIRLWIGCLAALVFAMVVVGGATRLTQSGLSIVEWKPVTGVIPPLSKADWQAEFDKYKTIPQYQRVNRGMDLGEFKTIFWWE